MCCTTLSFAKDVVWVADEDATDAKKKVAKSGKERVPVLVIVEGTLGRAYWMC